MKKCSLNPTCGTSKDDSVKRRKRDEIIRISDSVSNRDSLELGQILEHPKSERSDFDTSLVSLGRKTMQ